VSTSTGQRVTPDPGAVIRLSSLGADARSQVRDPQPIGAPPKVTPVSTSVQQFDAARRHLRAARPAAHRAAHAGALGRVKYTLPIEGRGPPGHAGDALYMTCPHCRLSIERNPQRLTIRHCPRWLGRNGTLVELFNSPLPAHVLYVDKKLP
jgi:hypothetical protein